MDVLFVFCVLNFQILYTLLGTNISHQSSLLKMIFLFPRWDMLVLCKVYFFLKLRRMKNSWQAHWEGNLGKGTCDIIQLFWAKEAYL